MKFGKILALTGCISWAALFLVFGCGTTESGTSGYSYGGPGSAYTASLNNDGTFTITHAPAVGSAVDLTITGTYVRYTNTGFLELTVGAVVGSGGPSVGDRAHGLEVPGFALLIKPAGDESNLIPMVASGSCPTADFSANWIVTDANDGNSATSTTADFLGTFAYTFAGNSATLPAKYALAGPFTSVGSGSVGSLGSCSGGVLTFTGGAMWLTTQGGALVHANAGSSTADQVIVAMPAAAITSTTGLAGNYGGLVFNKDATNGSGDRIFPVSVVATAPTSTTMSMTGTELTNVATGATGSGSATIAISAIDSPSAGFMTGTVSTSGPTGLMACMADEDVVSSGKNMIFCIAQSPDDNTQIFNLLLVSR